MAKDPWTVPDPQPGDFDDFLASVDPGDPRFVEAHEGDPDATLTLVVRVSGEDTAAWTSSPRRGDRSPARSSPSWCATPERVGLSAPADGVLALALVVVEVDDKLHRKQVAGENGVSASICQGEFSFPLTDFAAQ